MNNVKRIAEDMFMSFIAIILIIFGLLVVTFAFAFDIFLKMLPLVLSIMLAIALCRWGGII